MEHEDVRGGVVHQRLGAGLLGALCLLGCSKNDDRREGEVASGNQPSAHTKQAATPDVPRRAPLKREWQGAVLGGTEPELIGAMASAGFSGKCEDYGHKYLTRVDVARREQVREEPDGATYTVKECSFRPKTGASSAGVADIDATIVNGRLYRLMLELVSGETFEGVVNSLSDKIGAEPWKGTMSTIMVNSLSGQRQEDTSQSAWWSDDDTAIVADRWDSGTIAVSYSDLAAPRALDAARESAERALEKGKEKARSNVDF